MSAYREWSGYEPKFWESLDDFLAIHRSTLKSMAGKRLSRFLFPWQDGLQTRWVDGPIVLDFEGICLELEGSCCMFSVAVNTLDLDAPLPSGLVWVHDTPEIDCERFLGTRLQGIKILSCESGLAIVGLEFSFENEEILNVFDNGDETGIRAGKIDSRDLFTVAFS